MRRCLNCNNPVKGHPNKKHCKTACKNQFNNRKRPKSRLRKRYGVPEQLREARRRYIEKHKLLGLCRECSKPAITRNQCENHRDKRNKREKMRKYRSRYGDLWNERILIRELNSSIKEMTQ